MRKLALIILGLASLAGIITLICVLFLVIYQLIESGTINSDAIEWNIGLIIPIVFVCYLFYKLWKDKVFYHKRKITINILLWGVIFSVLISSAFLFYFIKTNADPFALIWVLMVLVSGFILSFVFSVMGWFIDKKRNEELISKNVKLFILCIIIIVLLISFFWPRRSTEIHSENMLSPTDTGLLFTNRDCKCIGFEVVVYSDNRRGSVYKCYGIPTCKEIPVWR